MGVRRERGDTSRSVCLLWFMAPKVSLPKVTLKEPRFWLLHLSNS